MRNATNSIWNDELRSRVLTLHSTHSSSQVVELLSTEGLTVTRNMVIGLWNRAGLKKPLGYRPHPVRRPKRQRPELKIVPGTKLQFAPGVPGNIAVKKCITPPPLRCVPLEPRHLSILDLEADSCRYPYGGDNPDEPITFCGHPKMPEKPYCAGHCALAYMPARPLSAAPRPFYREAWR